MKFLFAILLSWFTVAEASVSRASPLVRRIAMPYITNVFDTTGRLMGSRLKNSTHADLNRHSYVYNHANQRTNHTRWDASYVNYTYDNIGQLESARGYTSGGSSLANEQRGYHYDPAWNLNARTNNGVVTTFGVNVKNELTTQPNGTSVYDATAISPATACARIFMTMKIS